MRSKGLIWWGKSIGNQGLHACMVPLHFAACGILSQAVKKQWGSWICKMQHLLSLTEQDGMRTNNLPLPPPHTHTHVCACLPASTDFACATLSLLLLLLQLPGQV